MTDDPTRDDRHDADLPEDEDEPTPAPRRLEMSREVRGWIAGLSALVIALSAALPIGVFGHHDPAALLNAKTPVPPVTVPSSLSFIQTEDDLPESLFAGETRNLMFNFSTTSPVGSVFQPIFSIAEATTDACALGTVSTSAVAPIRDNEYVLFPPTAAGAVRTLMTPTGPGSKPTTLTKLDLEATLATNIRIDVPVYVRQDAALKQCQVTLQILETFPQASTVPSFHDLRVMDIIRYLPLPVAMGSVETEGGPWGDDDEAHVVLEAPKEVDVHSLLDSLSLPLTGLIAHQDGADWHDYGRFWFTVDGVQVGDAVKVAEAHDKTNIMAWNNFTAGVNGNVIDYQVCLHARYVDDGAYKDSDGQARTCATYHVKKVDQLPTALVDLPVLALMQKFGVPYVALPRLPVATAGPLAV